MCRRQVLLDNSALTKPEPCSLLWTEGLEKALVTGHRSRFQEKFGMAADVYGEQGMAQVKAAESGAPLPFQTRRAISSVADLSGSGKRGAEEEAGGLKRPCQLHPVVSASWQCRRWQGKV